MHKNETILFLSFIKAAKYMKYFIPHQ